MPPVERFRFHSVQKPEEQNLVRIPQAVKGVLLVQGVQAVGNFLVFAVPGQVMVAMLVMGAWNYFIHCLIHLNKFL
ncbi:unnamed protein product [Sphagnum jensenii]|uniref:Uncharacterized protein n=1 Tax=Sphagnum jensenii TaxID=128206 RepID=A0ABP1B096_9BRYO